MLKLVSFFHIYSSILEPVGNLHIIIDPKEHSEKRGLRRPIRMPEVKIHMVREESIIDLRYEVANSVIPGLVVYRCAGDREAIGLDEGVIVCRRQIERPFVAFRVPGVGKRRVPKWLLGAGLLPKMVEKGV